MGNIGNPHDAFFKRSMQTLEVARDFLKANLPKHILKRIKLDTLMLKSGNFVDEKLKSSMSDILYKVDTTLGTGYLYVLLEHQSRPEKMMAFRILKYIIEIMEQHIHQGHKTLPIVYAVEVYYGKKIPYPYSCEVFDLFEDEKAAREFLFKPFHLIDLTQTPDEKIRTFGLAAIFALIQKNIYCNEILPAIQLLAKWGAFTEADKARLVGYIKAMIEYLSEKAESNLPNLIWETLEKQLSHEKEAIMSIREKFEHIGERKGVKKGHYETALKMLRAGEPDMKIRQYTNLSQKEIDRLKKEVA